MELVVSRFFKTIKFFFDVIAKEANQASENSEGIKKR